MPGSRHPTKPSQIAQASTLIAALEEVYRDADHAFAQWKCPSSTECCRFGVTGREPYVTSIELYVMRRAIAARGGIRSWKRASSGEFDAARRGRLPIASEQRTCAMLTDEGRCAIYAARPLGCRTFYCDRATPGTRVRHREISALVRRVQEIASRHEPDGDRGRPLTRCL